VAGRVVSERGNKPMAYTLEEEEEEQKEENI
jgi:hypothetical protein